MRGFRIVALALTVALGGCETIGLGGEPEPAARPVQPSAPDLAPPLPVPQPPPPGSMLHPAPVEPAPAESQTKAEPAPAPEAPAADLPEDAPQAAGQTAPSAEEPSPAKPDRDVAAFVPCRLSAQVVMATAADCTQMGGVPLQ